VVRSRIIARSNFTNEATICIILRQAGEVVSMFSVRERRPAPALHDVQHVFQRAGEAVELPDRQRRSFPQVARQAVQLQPLPAAIRRGLLENAATAGGGRERSGPHEPGPHELVSSSTSDIAESRPLLADLPAFTNDRLCTRPCGTVSSSRIGFRYPVAELRLKCSAL
jgi:hypothetical protein